MRFGWFLGTYTAEFPLSRFIHLWVKLGKFLQAVEMNFNRCRDVPYYLSTLLAINQTILSVTKRRIVLVSTSPLSHQFFSESILNHRTCRQLSVEDQSSFHQWERHQKFFY